jgi:hypothetical protein
MWRLLKEPHFGDHPGCPLQWSPLSGLLEEITLRPSGRGFALDGDAWKISP